MQAPVRGGLKGGRRSVKRGQSVEFADFRDYTLGDDLRQLDWNVLARLEKLFVKLYVEEEDVTITFLVDASASMAAGQPDEARSSPSAPRRPSATSASPPRTGSSSPRSAAGPAGARSRCAAPGRVFRLLADAVRRSSRRTAPPTSSPRPATPAPS